MTPYFVCYPGKTESDFLCYSYGPTPPPGSHFSYHKNAKGKKRICKLFTVQRIEYELVVEICAREMGSRPGDQAMMEERVYVMESERNP